MTVKNREFNSKIFGYIGSTFGVAGTVLSFFDWSGNIKIAIFIVFIIFSLIFYFCSLRKVNKISSLSLEYGESTIEVKEGDIFSKKYKKNGIFRVFAFNEYFDTQVDDKIISNSSLNGQFINKEVCDVNKLDTKIHDDQHLKNHIKNSYKDRSVGGKHISYELGTIFKYSENVLLTAMTYFDDENKAKLTIQEYIKFLIQFWDEINSIYAGKTVVITLLGNGITRLDNNIYSSNQILEIILWTFYLRRIKFRKPAKLVILLDKDTNTRINYYKIRSMFNGLQK
ncbi:macro domain-containing protein [Lentilactobacillus buchneri]|uniref:macro domain-containing protein n=1 Tax=Lentilactobacillus buchneri TaxID=1581 RepID=UPI00345B5B74